MSAAPHILCLETTGDRCTLAISSGPDIIAQSEAPATRAHAEALAPLCEQLLRETGIRPDAVAISAGPGSYTGLRIGTSLAKGLCYAWQVPLIAIDTLALMAAAMRHDFPDAGPLRLIPMIDARRMEVYTAVYDENLYCLEPVQAKILEPDDFQALTQEATVVFAGSGAPKWQQHCRWSAEAHFPANGDPLAWNMALPAWKRLEAGQVENLAYFEPFYLKPFMATR
jgi:tRNA threonylcarbamoyladenosine biosynthesis protein TsaB